MNRPIHFEILTENPEKVLPFYEAVLGWKPATWDGPQTYWLMSTGDEEALGINGAIMGRHFDQAVINTVNVESLEKTLAQIEAHGGKLINGPNQVPGAGTHAYCADPDGIIFGVMEPLQNSA
ncbi:MAG: VOC family protein [Anaerolineales bacterium]|nr:VOC family protein [Chloroflexota bacterium]MBL6983243.1 VOC family protein [Anaerolineales bacterium]